MAEEKLVGWFKTYRKIEDWKYFKDPYVLQVFLFCLIHAERDNTEDKHLKKDEGSFKTTIVEIARILDKGRPKIYECLKILKKDGSIDYKKVGKETLITVLNYAKYQDNFVEKFSEKLD